MNNVIQMRSRTDWFVMNMIKAYIRELKASPVTPETIEAINRNEIALRSFHEDIKKRSLPTAA